MRESRPSKVAGIADLSGIMDVYMMCNTVEDFRACKGPIDLRDPDGVTISAQCAAALKVRVGDPIRYVAIRPQTQV